MISPTTPALTLRRDRRAFLRGLIGKPYQAGASGPDRFDCYGLARFVMGELFSIVLPDTRSGQIDRRAWRRCYPPKDGSIVLMGQTDTHIGVFIGGGVIHALDPDGVVFDDLLSLQFRGFTNLRTYSPA